MSATLSVIDPPVQISPKLRTIELIDDTDQPFLETRFYSNMPEGSTADWWLVMLTRKGIYSYDFNSQTWVLGLQPVYQGELVNFGFDNTQILLPRYSETPAGEDLILYFAVDLEMDGELNGNLHSTHISPFEY